MAIEITPQKRQGIPVKLIGVEYAARPPKSMVALRLAQQAQKASDDPEASIKALTQWLTMTFGKKDTAAILQRLEDPDDDLDIPHIAELMEKVTEAVSGNPTTSS